MYLRGNAETFDLAMRSKSSAASGTLGRYSVKTRTINYKLYDLGHNIELKGGTFVWGIASSYTLLVIAEVVFIVSVIIHGIVLLQLSFTHF